MTNSARDLVLLEALRWLRPLLFGMAGGAVADRIDRRWVLVGARTLALVECAASAMLATGLFNFGFALVATLLLGVQWAIDRPTRRALIPDLVGRERTVKAVALEALSQNVTRIIGPLLAGWLIAQWNASVAFACMAALYVIEIVLPKLMALTAPARAVASVPMLRHLVDAVDAISSSQPLLAVLCISRADECAGLSRISSSYRFSVATN